MKRQRRRASTASFSNGFCYKKLERNNKGIKCEREKIRGILIAKCHRNIAIDTKPMYLLQCSYFDTPQLCMRNDTRNIILSGILYQSTNQKKMRIARKIKQFFYFLPSFLLFVESVVFFNLSSPDQVISFSFCRKKSLKITPSSNV